MRHKSGPRGKASDKAIKDIRRATRKQYSAEEKIRIVLDGPFKRVAERSGLDPELVTPHVLRHTAITKLVKANIDLPTIQKISGHKTIAMVLRYTHVHSTHIDDAVSVLDTGSDVEKSDTVTHKLHKAEKS